MQLSNEWQPGGAGLMSLELTRKLGEAQHLLPWSGLAAEHYLCGSFSDVGYLRLAARQLLGQMGAHCLESVE